MAKIKSGKDIWICTRTRLLPVSKKSKSGKDFEHIELHSVIRRLIHANKIPWHEENGDGPARDDKLVVEANIGPVKSLWRRQKRTRPSQRLLDYV